MFTKLGLVLQVVNEITRTELIAMTVVPVLIVLFFYYKFGPNSGFVPGSLFGKKVGPIKFSGTKYTDAQANGALLKYFPYYKDLEKTQRVFFLNRLKAFMQTKEFIPRQTAPNETINLLIAATAIQMTFGLNDFSLHSFQKILIYPDAYYSKIRKTHHKGEINVRLRLIVLSAKHFLSGVKDPNDGLNLGLHEMAHALNVHTFEGDDLEMIQHFHTWSDEATLEAGNIDKNPNHFLRKYAATNIEEMFAVCTENFFERPEEFSKVLPRLYHQMMKLYQQDPRNHANPTGR